MTTCNLNNPLTLEKVDQILNRLLSDSEARPERASEYKVAIDHYNGLKLEFLGDKAK